MQKAFEIIGGLLILLFMGVVIWQSVNSNKSTKEVVTFDISEHIGVEETDGLDSESEAVEIIDEEIILPTDESTACTADAKICPDGSAVGRSGTGCEFDECPLIEEEDSKKIITCSPESKLAQACTMDYSPVCGLVEIQCITTPCNPIEETFSNGCVACSQGNVTSYTEGSCGGIRKAYAR